MPSIFVECPSCGVENKFDETLTGQPVQCQGCDATFEAEVGGSYDLAGPPPRISPDSPKASRRRRPASEEAGSEESEDEAPKSWLEPWPQD